MILIEPSIERSGIANVGKREWNQIKKNGYLKAASRWQSRMLPNHFTEGGGKKYGYTPRRKNYRDRKYREKGHRRPLVWSGESMARAMAGRVLSRRDGARVTIPAPALNYRNPKSRVNMRQEVTTIVSSEVAVLLDVMDKSIVTQLRSRPKRKRTLRG